MTQEAFVKLYSTDCSAHIEKKDCGNGRSLSYLSWAWAWAEFAAVHPDATYEVVKFNGLPYLSDATMGIVVYTRVTVDGLTREMWLPVMDSSNKAMKLEAYTYKQYNSYKQRWEDKYVKAADMFDINKTIMRCLTKNLAMFGLGLSIYAGEDVPQTLTALEEEAIKRDYEDEQQKKQQHRGSAQKQTTSPASQPAQKQTTSPALQPAQQQQQQQLQRLTAQMYSEGRLASCVDWLVARYDAAAAIIPAAVCDKLHSSYDWEESAFNAVVKEAKRKAFSADLQNS